MRRGRPHKPIISIESVTAALKMLDYSAQQSMSHQPLVNLLLVDLHLQTSQHTHVEDVREWTLRTLLVEIITQQVNQYRRNFELESIHGTESLKQSIVQLKQSFGDTSDHVQGWHLLYIRYCRPDLGFSVQELAQHTNTTVRTLQRHQQKAIHLLRDTLIALESEARQQHHRVYLRQQIRGQITPLFGREHHVQAIMSHLENDYPQPVLVCGTQGIGKTALITAITDMLIEQNRIDEIVWVQQPETLENIPTLIWDKLQLRQSPADWQELLHYTQMLIVLDGADAIDLSSDAWRELTYDLKGTYILVTRRESAMDAEGVFHVLLEGLDQKHSEELIKSKRVGDFAVTQEMLDLCQGIPSKLAQVAYHVKEQVTAMNDDFDIIGLLWGPNLTDEALVAIIFSFLAGDAVPDWIQQTIPIDSLTTLYFDFAKQQYGEKANLHLIAEQWLHTLLANEALDVRACEFLLTIVATDWLGFSSTILVTVLESTQPETLSQMGLTRWRYLYMKNTEFATMSHIRLQYGIVLQRLRLVEDARDVLRSVIEQSGKSSDFQTQLIALYHLAQLLQSQGELDTAIDIYTDLARSRLNDIGTLRSQVQLQLARIALAREQAESVLSLLMGIDSALPHADILRCEAHLLLNDHDYLDLAIANKLAMPSLRLREKAALYTIWGRSYTQRDNLAQAIIHLNEALLLAEQVGDEFDIARARLNLCALYLADTENLERNFLDEIEDHLKITQHIQHRIGDVVGQQATLHNLQILRQRRLL